MEEVQREGREEECSELQGPWQKRWGGRCGEDNVQMCRGGVWPQEKTRVVCWIPFSSNARHATDAKFGQRSKRKCFPLGIRVGRLGFIQIWYMLHCYK